MTDNASFVAGDLLLNDGHQGCVYLVVEHTDSDKELRLVLLYRAGGGPPTICSVGNVASGLWNHPDGMKQAGFRKVGQLTRGPILK